MNTAFWNAMRESMPPVFPRKSVEKLTGGLLSARVMANLDSQGQGPSVKVRIGKHINYARDNFIEWLQDRSS